MQQYLDNLETDPLRKHKIKRKNLCQTEAGNNCDYLVITDYKDGKNEEKKEKKTIMITSRVHPGESMASYMMEYIIDYLTGTSIESQLLRENFIFKIIPMLNPDGVLNGNYRVGLCAQDLNRQWANPSKQNHPTIYYAKQMVKKLKENKNLIFYCDIHGHSRKKNLFMYGCSGKDLTKKELAFPYLMKQMCPVFSFKDCSFVVQKEKEGTARIALWKEFNLIHCYTLEASFCGADFGKYEFFHYNQEIFYEMAESFCKCLIDMFDPDQTKVKQAIEEAEAFLNGYDKGRNNNRGDSDADSDYENSDEDKKKEEKKTENNEKIDEKKDNKDKKKSIFQPVKKKK